MFLTLVSAFGISLVVVLATMPLLISYLHKINYNQTVKAIHTNFNDRRAVALLARLEKYTQELTLLFGQVVRLTEEFNRRWSAE